MDVCAFAPSAACMHACLTHGVQCPVCCLVAAAYGGFAYGEVWHTVLVYLCISCLHMTV